VKGREFEPIPLAVRSAVGGRLIAGIAGSNPAEGIDVRRGLGQSLFVALQKKESLRTSGTDVV
jgi:hypothetical protein